MRDVEGLVSGLYVRIVGEGPTVVLLHGNSEDSTALAPVADDLAPDFRVVSIDARAHGRSPRGTGPLTIARMADDVAAVLDAISRRGTGDRSAAVPSPSASGAPDGRTAGPQSSSAPALVDRAVSVVGYSDGGNVALMLALRHPALVRALVIYGANSDPAGMTAPIRAGVTALWLAQRVRGVFSPEARVRAEVTDLMVHQPRIPLRALGRIDVPVAVLAGEHDMIRREHTEAIAAALRSGTCVIVPGADHSFPMSDPAAFAARVRTFLPH